MSVCASVAFIPCSHLQINRIIVKKIDRMFNFIWLDDVHFYFQLVGQLYVQK